MSKFIPLILLIAFWFVPDITIAQVAPGGFVPCNGADCSACNLVGMVNTIIIWMFGIIFLIFAYLMVVAGFGLVTSGGNSSALDAAKSKFTNAIIGVIIVMAAWLFVDTIMRQLLTGGGNLGVAGFTGFGPWAEVQCSEQTTATRWARSGNDITNPALITPPAAPAAGTLAHAAAVSSLGGGFTISSSGNCSDRNNRACTSLDGIQPLTITRVKALQAAVGVPLIVTGGTEIGHAASTYSHGTGYKIDIRPEPALNTYITTTYTPVSGSTSRWKDPAGNIYYRHGPPDHWDILITN